jgi:hypothetical protein
MIRTMFTFLVTLEVSLRIMTDGSHHLLARYRRRKGMDSKLGFWRSLAGTTGAALDEAPKE